MIVLDQIEKDPISMKSVKHDVDPVNCKDNLKLELNVKNIVKEIRKKRACLHVKEYIHQEVRSIIKNILDHSKMRNCIVSDL
jgi:hypothetical protein